jgi:hypothetical protein
MMWKDTLLPGGSRTPVAVGTPGSVPDYYGTPVGRMDFVMGPNGVPVISGSSEAQPGAGPLAMAGPSPGFLPVDPGQYGSNPFFAGRVPSASSLVQGPQSALASFAGKSAELEALLRALGALGQPQAAVPATSGGLRIAE